MSKTAQQAAEKYASRAPLAGSDYVKGAQETSKDQSALAIAAKENYKIGVTESISRGAYEKGLQKSGKSGWLRGITMKGEGRYSEGVSAGKEKYASNSARFDTARNAAAAAPRGPKGSATNLNRVSLVVTALRKAKTGA